MSWVLIAVGWLLLALLIAVLIGRSVHLADARTDTDDAQHDDPNFVVDPASAPDVSPDAAAPSPGRDAPTVPGIPVARPKAPGARNLGRQNKPIRKTGLG